MPRAAGRPRSIHLLLRSIVSILAVALALLTLSGGANADDSYRLTAQDTVHIRVVDWRPADTSLQDWTAIDGDYTVVQPKPEPDEALPADGNGTFKIGDTDVRISGSIIVDIGTGSIRPPAH